MNIKGFVWACALAGMLLPGSKAIAQANMKNGFLNVQMREALCGQNWPRAIQVLDTMKRISPKDRSSLERYRSFLVNFRNNNTRIAAWPAPDYCAGTVEALPNPNATSPNPGSGSNPNMRTDTVPTF